MRAVVWHGRGDVRVEDVPEPPTPGPGQVKVAVERSGVKILVRPHEPPVP